MAEYYDVAFTAVEIIGPGKKHPWLIWPAFVQLKALYYRATAQFYMAVAAVREEKYGEQVRSLSRVFGPPHLPEVSRLRAACQLIDDLVALNKKSKVLEGDDGANFFAVARATLEQAQRDNTSVWHRSQSMCVA